jgi:uncharacterized OB-fold protein
MSAPSTRDSALYWQRVGDLGFALPHCDNCGRFHFYPRAACPFCHSERVAPKTASGRGTVYSYSVVYRAPSPAFAADVPYVVAIVATDEGPHLLTRIVDVPPEAVRIGMAVRVSSFDPGREPVFGPESIARE